MWIVWSPIFALGLWRRFNRRPCPTTLIVKTSKFPPLNPQQARRDLPYQCTRPPAPETLCSPKTLHICHTVMSPR